MTPTTVTVNNLANAIAADRWIFAGTGPDDLFPVWTHQGSVAATRNQVSLSLPPVSVTVLDITASGKATPVPGRVEAEDFDEDVFSDTTAWNEGGAYRSTPGWQIWQTVSRPNVPLTAGVHQLTFVSVTGWFNLNWLELQPARQ